MNKGTKYYCSVKGCLFSEEKGKHFKRKMLMEQHFLNCHSERKYKCNKCGKSYAIDWQLKYHLKTCGLIWKCLTCDKSYKERLSLVTHCKRHLHILPSEAKRRKSKNNLNCSLNVILLPVISNLSQTKTQPATNQKQILPKIDFNSNSSLKKTDQNVVNFLNQPNNVRLLTRRSSGTLKEREVNSILKIKRAQRATQTEKLTKKSASRSAQCPPMMGVFLKKKPETNLESTETQTLESILFESNSLLTLTKATSTCFPCNCDYNTSNSLETNNDLISILDSCELNQNCSFLSPLIKSSNPLLCQFNNNLEVSTQSKTQVATNGSDNLIFEQSVQTDEADNYFFCLLNDTETQTSNEFLNEIDFINFTPLNSEESELFLNQLELNDIETQTIFSKSQTTQTDNSQHQKKDKHFFY